MSIASCTFGHGFLRITLVHRPALHSSTNLLPPRAAKQDTNSPPSSLDSSTLPSDPSSRSFKGFGSRPDPNPKDKTSNSKSSTTSRRPAPVKPVIAPDLDPDARQTENAFILTLTTIGIVIFVEGIALAASGLLPEEWDAMITKFVYPAFTPTVGLFLAGAVFYGVYKALQGKPSGDN